MMGSNTNLNDVSNFIITCLDLWEGVTLEELVKRIEQRRKASILISSALLPINVSGFSFRDTDNYYIFYNSQRKGRPLLQILLHELTHILKGHADNLEPLNVTEVLLSVQQGKKLGLIEGIVCRAGETAFNDYENFKQKAVTEREVEYLASRLLQMVVSVEECNLDQTAEFWLQ